MARNRVIGRDNQLPWHLPADLKHFKSLTLGKPILMGRKTFESIGRPLPSRTNIILTRASSYAADGCLVAHSVEEALSLAGGVEEVMVIGGAQLYEALLERADRIYLTEVLEDFQGDARFPLLQPGAWQELSREEHPADEANPHPYRFSVLERRRRA
jgi:dihydrofolate reductase